MRYFADTHYFLAIINPDDVAHKRAVDYSKKTDLALVSTAWVFTELANGMSRSRDRALFTTILEDFAADPLSLMLLPDERLFRLGIALYQQRPDKDWSLTDCISFVVMEEQGLREALTADRQFEQAGFIALLK